MANNDIVSGFDDEKDENLKISLQKVKNAEKCLVITLIGHIDAYNSGFFQKCVLKAIEEGYIKLIFQCTSLNYVSSTRISSFKTFLKAVKPKGGDIVLLDIQPKVYEVFQRLDFSQFFNIRDNLSDSIAFFQDGVTGEKTSIFPRIVSCPNCSQKLRAAKYGRFRCSECKSILVIDKSGQVMLK